MKRDRYCLSVAVFILLMKGDQICLFQRYGTGWMDGYMSVPAGGLEYGEPLKTAAIREAKEEVGVTIAAEDLILCHTLHSWTEERSWMGHFFTCTKWCGNPVIAEPEKHKDLRWVNIAHLPSNIIPYVKQATKCITASQPYSEYDWVKA